MPEFTLEPATHCPHCKAEYVNHQHPTKPLGVVMMRTCRCEAVTQSVPGGTVTMLVPPKEAV